MKKDISYNERLFSGGFRAKIHLVRFNWLKRMVQRYAGICNPRVLELGCYDGRSVDWLPEKPAIYDGYDANWEGGLDLGRQQFADQKNIRFHLCVNPGEMSLDPEGYDFGISLETMEHIPLEMVDDYLAVISKSVKQAAFFTVPNEIGIPFFVKYLAKKIMFRDSKDEPYSLLEFWYEVMGRTNRVHRNEHKGFDYRRFICQVEKYMDVEKVEGIPYPWLGAGLSFTVGIVARPRQN